MDTNRMLATLENLGQFIIRSDAFYLGFSQSELDKLLSVRIKDDLVLLNYTAAAQYANSWTDPLRMCRGIIFNTKGELVSFPFHKFFNINEHPETAYSNIAKWHIRSATEKIDGVLIQLFQYNGDLIWASRHNLWTPPAELARSIAGEAIHDLIKRIPASRWTFMLELVHDQIWQPGMVPPKGEVALYPLAIRNLDTLELIPAVEIWYAVPPPFKLPKQHYIVRSIDRALEVVLQTETPDWEGLVLQGTDNDGNNLVKIKSPLYLKRLALVKGLSSKRLMQTYEHGGWSSVAELTNGIEEIILNTNLGIILQALRNTEKDVVRQAKEYAELPANRIQEIPFEWRWCIGYKDKPEKFEQAIRRMVVRVIEHSNIEEVTFDIN